jgi:hypothetical protein
LPPIGPETAWNKGLQRFAQQIGQKNAFKIKVLENGFGAVHKTRIFPGGTANCV